MANYLMLRSQDEDRIFTRAVAAQLARITLDFLAECEREALVQPRPMFGSEEGYTHGDIEEIARIRRLQQDLELDLGAVEVVLHMRQRMLEMLEEIEALEETMWQREQQLRREISRLRQELAREGTFR
jgi:DNA-binding transcriptional MerR regulator